MVKYILKFPGKVVVIYNLWILEMQMCEFFQENFAEQVVILLNCPKGR